MEEGKMPPIAKKPEKGVPNMQDFRALKQIEDLNELYTIGREIGTGSYGAVCEAT